MNLSKFYKKCWVVYPGCCMSSIYEILLHGHQSIAASLLIIGQMSEERIHARCVFLELLQQSDPQILSTENLSKKNQRLL